MSRSVRWCLRAATAEGPALDVDDGVRERSRGGSWRWIAVIALALVVVGGFALATRGTTAPWSPAVPRIDARHTADLPVTDLGWVTMRDHFTVTIGDRAGQGAGLGELLVVADTTLAPHAAFPVHRHAGIEVVTVVLDGTLTHDEGGRALELPAGSVQLIVAGAGIDHAEANRADQPVRFLQLWLASPSPDRAPAEQTLTPASGPDFAPLPLDQLRPDVQVRRGSLAPGASVTWTVARGRVAYVVCVGGQLDLDTAHLADGDGALLTDGRFTASASATEQARLIVIDVPAPR